MAVSDRAEDQAPPVRRIVPPNDCDTGPPVTFLSAVTVFCANSAPTGNIFLLISMSVFLSP